MALAGLSAGFFAWYVLATHGGFHGKADVAFGPMLVAAIPLTLAYWYGYAWFISHTWELEFERFALIDALTFSAFVALWLYVFVPGLASAPAPLLGGALIFAHLAARLAILCYCFRAVRIVTAVFLSTRVAVMIIATLANIVIGERSGTHWSPGHGLLLDIWTRWDGQHYLAIAQSGYHGKDVAFFPLYPLLISVLGRLIGDHAIAGIIISNAAFFAALAFLYALAKLEFGDDDVAFHAVFYIAIFPTATFFSSVYTESLFLALTVASVYFARHGNFITAGVFGALASATRFGGILLALPIAYEAWHAWKERRGTALARGIIGLALVPAGLLAYMLYLFVLTGNAMAFQDAQANWNRHLAPPWVSIANSVREIATHPLTSTATATHLIELTFTAVFLVLLVYAIRMLRPSYWSYFAASLLIPMSTASLMSMPRFVLVVFPAFMLLAVWGRVPVFNSVIVSLFLPLLGLFTVFFADWYWLA